MKLNKGAGSNEITIEMLTLEEFGIEKLTDSERNLQ